MGIHSFLESLEMSLCNYVSWEFLSFKSHSLKISKLFYNYIKQAKRENAIWSLYNNTKIFYRFKKVTYIPRVNLRRKCLYTKFLLMKSIWATAAAWIFTSFLPPIWLRSTVHLLVHAPKSIPSNIEFLCVEKSTN